MGRKCRIPSKRTRILWTEQSGQALNDYGLALGLIAVVLVFSVGAMGNNLSAFFGDIISVKATKPSDAAKPSPQVQTALTEPTQPTASAPIPEPPTPLPTEQVSYANADTQFTVTPPTPAKGYEQICYENGFCANIPVVNIETVGTNGSEWTRKFAISLTQIAKTLKEQNYPPDVVSQISNLANKGHGIASSLRKLHNNLETTSEQRFSPNKTAFISQFAKFKQFIKANPQSLPPEVNQIIMTQAGQILKIANGIRPTRISTLSGGREMILDSATRLTRQRSNTICAQGGRKCYRKE